MEVLAVERLSVGPGLLSRVPAGTPHPFASPGAEPRVRYDTAIRVVPA